MSSKKGPYFSRITALEGEFGGVIHGTTEAVTKQMVGRYNKASKSEKGVMLTELCALTGWNPPAR